MSTFNSRKQPERNTDYQAHAASALSISYSVKSGSHTDAEFMLEGQREKARLLLCTSEGEQATLVLEAEEIEALRDRLNEVLAE